jgi:hypothetical protein
VIKVSRAEALAARLERERHRRGPAPQAPRGFDIECCDFRALDARHVDLIFTDPMWSDTAIWAELGKWAHKVLAPGGILAAYCGVPYLPTALNGLGKHLRYHWMASLYHPAQQKFCRHYRVKAGWAPLVIFSKGPWKDRSDSAHWYFLDTCWTTRKEKEYDEYQQSLPEAEYYVEALSDRGALVCDPFSGSFTTAVACLKLRRRFIGCDTNPGKVTGGLHRLAGLEPKPS